MKALNEKERISLMWQSAIGIIIVVILLMVVCYYDFELPIQLSTSERKDLETGRSIIHNQKIILSQIQIIDSLVDSTYFYSSL